MTLDEWVKGALAKERMPYLYLYGPPGSGKTQFVNELARQGLCVVRHDNSMGAFNGHLLDADIAHVETRPSASLVNPPYLTIHRRMWNPVTKRTVLNWIHEANEPPRPSLRWNMRKVLAICLPERPE